MGMKERGEEKVAQEAMRKRKKEGNLGYVLYCENALLATI